VIIVPTTIIVLVSKRPSKLTQEVFFGYVDLMSFEDRSASGSQGICDLFAEFIERTYVDD
jgi:hypothetical protein